MLPKEVGDSVRKQTLGVNRPVWNGPEKDGVTFSLLSRWLCCRERFRLLVVEGLRPVDSWNHKLFFGSAWHVAEEALAAATPSRRWEADLLEFAKAQSQRYPLAREQVDHWYHVVRVAFPLYVAYWARHPDTVSRTPLLQEQVFSVPYKLPSGRTVRLRGKWDAVDLIGKGEDAGVYLFETKTKGQIVEAQLKRQLSFDLQTGLYLTALVVASGDTGVRTPAWVIGENGYPIRGVRYNVVRRPLSGGKGSIVRHKGSKNVPPESKGDYYKRVAGIIESSPDEFFMRWTVTVTPADIAKFRRECLDPVLEQLCRWWGYISQSGMDEFGPHRLSDAGGIHWRHPFGVWNVLDEGGASDLDEYLATGSTLGLTRVDELFSELKE